MWEISPPSPRNANSTYPTHPRDTFKIWWNFQFASYYYPGKLMVRWNATWLLLQTKLIFLSFRGWIPSQPYKEAGRWQMLLSSNSWRAANQDSENSLHWMLLCFGNGWTGESEQSVQVQGAKFYVGVVHFDVPLVWNCMASNYNFVSVNRSGTAGIHSLSGDKF